VWFKKKKSKPVTRNVRMNKLRIIFKDNSPDLVFIFADYKGNDIIKPWAKFYNWFFSRTSEAYAIKSENEITVLLRSNISKFEMKILTEERVVENEC
jgi:hypothetical protein